MPSPFPGMNPYLERVEVWHDFHTRFIPAAATAIGRLVAPRYFTKIEEHLYVHEPSAQERFSLGRPEISVHPRIDAAPSAGSVGLVEAPASVGLLTDVDFERIRYLEIHIPERSVPISTGSESIFGPKSMPAKREMNAGEDCSKN